MKHISLIVAVLLMTGCAGKWNHSYKSQQEFYRDNARCQAMSRGGGNQAMYNSDPAWQGYNQNMAIGSAIQSSRIYEECMYGEGYYRE